MKILVTGGAGFIGSNFVKSTVASGHCICVIDALTYAGSLDNLPQDAPAGALKFVHGRIEDPACVDQAIAEFQPDWIVNFAAESHVDRSISSSYNFLQSNVVGTHNLLNAALVYYQQLDAGAQESFRFLQISTDEVYGSLTNEDPPFKETNPFEPNNPYSASKAAGDHFVRAYSRTHKLPTLITHCSNNYGPFQFPEKFIPTVIRRALSGEIIPVYGDGSNRRDWLHVADHCEAVLAVLERGTPGEAYNIGGGTEVSNLELAKKICAALDEVKSVEKSHAGLIQFVEDRKGHDFRYAIDSSKIERDVGWKASRVLDRNLQETVLWYLENQSWVDAALVAEAHKS